jgi:ATP-dependent Clp protease adaptor protein ClpS
LPHSIVSVADESAGAGSMRGAYALLTESLERRRRHDYYVRGVARRSRAAIDSLRKAGVGPAADDRTMIPPTDPTKQTAREAPPAPRLADDDRKRRGDAGQPGSAVITKTRPQTKRPNMYRVLLLNDDYTPMEFVVHVLERFFNKDRESATRIMLHVHQNGIGECGIFTYEVAETKVTQVMDFARKHQHPLQCVMEKK